MQTKPDKSTWVILSLLFLLLFGLMTAGACRLFTVFEGVTPTSTKTGPVTKTPTPKSLISKTVTQGTLSSFDLTRTAFAGRNLFSKTPTKFGYVTPTRTSTKPYPSWTVTLTVYHPAWYYYTLTMTRTITSTITRTRTQTRTLEPPYKTQTQEYYNGLLTKTAQRKTYEAIKLTRTHYVTETAVASKTLGALTTLTRTSMAKTAQEQTVQAQVKTQYYHITQTAIAKTASNRLTQTVQYWPNQTAVAETLQPTYAYTRASDPTPDPHPRVAYTGKLDGYGAVFVKGIDKTDPELWAFVSGSKETVLGDVSPDGKRVVISLDGELYLAYPRLSKPKIDKIPNQPSGENTMAAFSPDGEWIVFRNDKGPDLYIIKPDGKSCKPITKDSDDEKYPDWSPDGTLLILTINQKLYTLDVSVKPPPSPLPVPQALDGATGTFGEAHFSPSGSKLVFSRQSSTKWYVYTARFTANPNKISNMVILDKDYSSNDDPQPAWSENGILFVYDNKIYMVQPFVTTPEPIDNTDGASNPNWAP